MKVKETYQVAKYVSDLDWDADSTRIVAAGDGALKAKVFSWDSGNNLGEITMHSHPIISCSYRKVRPFRIATGSEDLSVNLYEGPPFKFSKTSKGHARYPNGVRFSPDGARFASVGADQKIVLYDGKDGTILKETDDKTPEKHKGAIYAFSWSPDSKQLLTASADKTAKIWNADDLSVVATFTLGSDINDQQVGALWTQSHLISVSLSGAINYLNRDDPSKPLRILHGHQTSIQSIALDKANGIFYTAGLSGEVTRWNFTTGDSKWLTGKSHGGKTIVDLQLSQDGKNLLTFGMDDKVRSSPVTSDEISSDAGDLGGLPVAAAVSPTAASTSVAVLAQDKMVLLDGIKVVQTVALGFTPTAVTFSNDGSKVLVGGKDKKIHIYDLNGSALKESRTIDIHDKPVTSIAYSPDGRLIASTDLEASIYFHTADGYELKNKSGWRFHQAGVKMVDWQPDSKRVITGSIDCHLILWHDLVDFQGGQRSRCKDAHLDGANFVKFWDQNTIISVGGERSIKVWSVPQ